MQSNLRKLNHQATHQSKQTLFRFTPLALLLLLLLLGGLTLRRMQTTAAAQDNPLVGPGLQNVGSNAQRSAASSSKAGSLLFFHKYTSNAQAASNANTLLTLTNTHPSAGIAVRLSWVHGCTVETSFVTLAGNQTRTLVASAENPNQTGYLMALAVSSTGQPIQFNWLIGSASYRDARGFEATYNAFAVAKRTNGAARLASEGVAEILFNNTEYDRLPRQIAVTNLQNQDPNVTGGETALKTDVMVYSPLSNLASSSSQGLNFDAVLNDQSGRPYPQVVESPCGLNSPITSVWREVSFNSVVTPERQGYATFAAKNAANQPVPALGLSLTEGVQSARHSALQMQVLSWVDSFRMTVPMTQPPSAPNDPITTNQPDAAGGSLGASESKAGSLLVFQRFTSGIYGNTQLSLTNTHPTLRARLRVFFTGLVEPALVNENIITLQPNQTTTLDANDFAANQKGWVFVMAIDGRAQPFQFNFIIGSAQVSEQTTGMVTGYNALALAKNSAGAAARNSDGVTTDLLFDGINYDRLPATLALNGVANQTDNTTSFGFARPPLSLLETPNARGSLGVTLYDDLLASFGATIGQIEVKLSQVRNNAQAPLLTSTIQKGHRGWLKLSSSAPIFAWFNNQAEAPFAAGGGAAWTGGLKGGTNLQILTLADTYLLRTPGNNPGNRPPIAEFEPIDAVLEARSNKGANVRLDGRVSSDPDGEDDPLSFKWFDNEQQISIAKVSDYRFGLGTHVLRLSVLDGNNTPSEPNQYLFQVTDTQPPIISGVPSTLTKVVSSQAGIGLSYPLPVAYDYVDGKVNVTASKPPGSLFPLGKTTVIFTARDNAGNISTARMDVTLTKGDGTLPTKGGVPGNILPVMPNLNDQYVLIGQAKTITLQATDDNNDAVSFALLNAPSFVRLDNPDPVNRTAKLIIEPYAGAQAAATAVRIVATDSRGGAFSTLPFRIQISDTETDEEGTGLGPTGPPDPGTGVPGPIPPTGSNNPPVAKMVPLPATAQATIKQGAIVKFDGSPSSDPDLDTLTYVWKDNGVQIAEGAIVEVTLAVGIHSITLTVTDPKDGTDTTTPALIEVLPRPLTVSSASPAKIPLFNQVTMTIRGTGFFSNSNPSLATKVRFDCTSFCQGGSQVQVTITNIEEDTITLTAKTTQNTPFGNRDCIVTNPNGTSVKLSRSNVVSK
jgi:hypothetical protein